MTTYAHPADPTAIFNFSFADRNDLGPSDYPTIDDFLAETQHLSDHAFGTFSEMPLQGSQSDFPFPATFDPSFQEIAPKDVPSSYSQLHSATQSRSVSQASSPHSNPYMMSAYSDSQIWPYEQMLDMRTGLPQISTHFPLPTCANHQEGYEAYASHQGTLSVDPSCIQQIPSPMSAHPDPSPAPLRPASQVPSLSSSKSDDSYQSWNQATVGSPVHQASPISPRRPSRNPSVHSLSSIASHGSSGANFGMVDEDGNQRTQCPYPECGKSFKDLKAHMLTHQNERPEKCPIVSCDFHKRGFARKYDRNRHLITTHYKATVVCGFCPGEGSATEMSFNRVDMFKRHLVSAHRAEQNSGSSKKRSFRGSPKPLPPSTKDTSGSCTTCGNSFTNVQELFDHLDDCILHVVTKPDACESVNERNLRQVVADENVQATMKRHALANCPPNSVPSMYAENDDAAAEENENEGSRARKARKINHDSSLSVINDTQVASNNDQEPHRTGHPGLTYSKGGVDLNVAKGRKKRKHYPQSWGCAMDDMTLKKRVLCCFDGQRRLLKDDMMLGNDFQQRIMLPDGGYVTDLDVETLRRAEAFHNATEEEKGPWLPTNYADPVMLQQAA